MKKCLLILLCMWLLTLSVCAADFGYVYDNADLYTDDEEAKIAEAAEKIYTNDRVACVIVTDYGMGDILRMLPAYAGSEDIVLLTVDMSARTFELYQYNATHGESAFRISASESDAILDGILPSMADADYADAAHTFLELAKICFTGGEAFDPSDTGGDYTYQEYGKTFSFRTVLLPLLIGMAAGGISVLCVYGVYKRKVHGAIYPLGEFAKLNLIDAKDTFVTKSVIVTRIPDPPSGGGGASRSGGSRGGGARMGGRSF